MSKMLRYKIKSTIKSIIKRKKITDDFDWELYHEHYEGEVAESGKKHTRILSPGDYLFKENELTINNEILPLHPNCHLLYETILQLSPESVMEIGCGGGDNLRNINVLAPHIVLYGRDISTEQINFLKKRHPRLDAAISQLDVTLPHPLNSPKVDIVFTQAVLMHIKTGNGHLVALANLFHYASKQIILMENWNNHNFKADIELLFSKQMLPWKDVYMYYSDSSEYQKPHIMILSSTPLVTYKRLSDYSCFLR